MQRLRQASVLARLVLAWFVLATGVAIASPLVQPAAVQLVCSGAGTIKFVQSGDGAEAPLAPTLDCPLCASVATLPVPMVAASRPQPLGRVLQSIPAARHAVRIAAPLPARGPPPLA